MCGIVGLLGTGSESELEIMLSKISHRGPDASGTFFNSDKKIYLGHRRLSIIDLDTRSNQPLWDLNNKACIIFNGEIYNYKELKKNLIQTKDISFKTNGDAEVILNMYLYGGPNWLDSLEGMFAFSIWDPAKNITLIARDSFGVKPLYFSSIGKGIAFSSEIKSFIELDAFNKSIDYDSLLLNLIFLWSPGTKTIFQSVNKLEPGKYLVIQDGKIIESANFSKLPRYRPSSFSNEEAIDGIKSTLKDSIQGQLTSDVKVGAFLSGGVDSSSIVAIAKEVDPNQELPCFTIENLNTGNNDGFDDDLPFAKKVSNRLGCNLNIVNVTPNIFNDLPKMIYHLDEPQADPAPLNVLYISELAKQNGIKVLLSGSGGDDIFSGYRRHLAVKYEKFWIFLPKIFRQSLQTFSRKIKPKSAFLRRLSKAFSYASLNTEDRILSYFFWLPPERAIRLFTQKIRDSLSKEPFFEILNDHDYKLISDPLEKMLYLERKYFLVDHNFNYTDKMSMSQGVEVRVPFLDKRVVEHASRINSKLKVNKTTPKWILKESVKEYIGEDIINRSKSGFGAPLRSWLNNDLKEYVDDFLSEKSINSRGVFDYNEVKSLLEEDRRGISDFSYPIFSLVCIELWFRIFLDKSIKI